MPQQRQDAAEQNATLAVKHYEANRKERELAAARLAARACALNWTTPCLPYIPPDNLMDPHRQCHDADYHDPAESSMWT